MNITCSALPEQLLESELFGHERGAFTDARHAEARAARDRPTAARCSSTRSARWRRRCRPSCCASSRRRSFKRVGGAADIRVDVRVIAATNRDLEDEVAEGPLPRGPLLPAERAADRAAAAARASRRHPAAGRVLRRHASTREFRKRIRGATPAAMRAAAGATAGPATCASCATPSSARCCWPTAIGWTSRDFCRRRRTTPPASTRSSCRRAASISSSSNAALVVQALRRTGGNQTQAGGAARPQPRSDPLPDREVLACQCAVRGSQSCTSLSVP